MGGTPLACCSQRPDLHAETRRSANLSFPILAVLSLNETSKCRSVQRGTSQRSGRRKHHTFSLLPCYRCLTYRAPCAKTHRLPAHTRQRLEFAGYGPRHAVNARRFEPARFVAVSQPIPACDPPRSQILILVGQRRLLRVSELLLVLCHGGGVNGDLGRLERRRLNEAQIGIAD